MRRRFRLFCAAVVAEFRSSRDVLLTIWAIHRVTLTEQFCLALLYSIRRCLKKVSRIGSLNPIGSILQERFTATVIWLV